MIILLQNSTPPHKNPIVHPIIISHILWFQKLVQQATETDDLDALQDDYSLVAGRYISYFYFKGSNFF